MARRFLGSSPMCILDPMQKSLKAEQGVSDWITRGFKSQQPLWNEVNNAVR